MAKREIRDAAKHLQAELVRKCHLDPIADNCPLVMKIFRSPEGTVTGNVSYKRNPKVDVFCHKNILSFL